MPDSNPQPSIPRHRPLVGPALLFLALLATSFGLLLTSAMLGRASLDPFLDPLTWLATLDVDAANEILSNAAEVVAAVLAVSVTVVAIVVELAANRYSHEITRLFLREPVNLIVLGILVLTTVQCVWTATVISETSAEALIPHAGFAITLTMVTISLLLLVPYIYFVFTFLSPISVIQRICRDSYRVILKVREDNVVRSQKKVQDAVDELQDVARSAIQQGDRAIAMAAVDALSNLLFDYVRIRHRLPRDWFEVTAAVAADPDFVALAPESMAEVRDHGLWLERKILRRYLSLMGQASGHARDVAYLIGINTQRIAAELGPVHPYLLELALRAFNSYLRTTITTRDPRTAYYLMSLYRMLASRLMRLGYPEQAIAIAEYLKEYGQLAHKQSMSFLLETAAHDLGQLIEDAVSLESPAVDPLLDRLLELDQEIKEESHEESLLGVRRAQIQIATLFLKLDQRRRAERIIVDLRDERLERLERLRLNLMYDDREQFWELMDRGVNFAYLAPDRRPYLDEIFAELRGSEAKVGVASA
jgi:hypothetical protein